MTLTNKHTSGLELDRYVMTQSHGTIHTMDDHLEFLYDPLLGKPVEWHMHSRNRIFGSHTDEYKVRYLSFKEKKAGESVTIDLPSECKEGSDKLKTLSGERRGFAFGRRF